MCIVSAQPAHLKGSEPNAVKVRFGSKADSCSAATHVRFTPNSDRESGHPQEFMSALPPKADMCSALAHVCFGPIADIYHYSTTSSASAINLAGISKFSAFAVLRLITKSNLVDCITGKSEGFSPLRIRPTYMPAWR